MAMSKMEDNILIGKMQKIMNLRSKGYAVNFDFPAIVVIGSQSSGKSSVIESIIGRHLLPRGTNMVTRCPIVINLYHEENLEKDYAQFAPTHWERNPQRIEDFERVKNEILIRMNKLVNPKHVTDEMITLNIHSENYPNNLQMIDLPGFVRNNLPEQPVDIKEQIENLVRKFIERDNVIILAVSDANVDIADSAAIAEARRVDEKGLRTIGVLTKVDLTTKERHIPLIALLNNKLLPLSKGYVAVINPPAEHGEEETIDQMRKKEMALFQKLGHIHHHKIQNYGTTYLQRILSKELTQKIKEKIPELVLKVTEELESIEQEIDSLDYKNESAQPVSQRLLKKIKIYQKAVTVMLKGNSREVSHKQIEGGAKLKKLLKQGMKKACKEAMKLNPSKFGKAIEIMLDNLDATYDSILPNSLAFQSCVAILVEKFKKPMTLLIATFSEHLNSYLRKCAEETLALVPNLQQKVIEMASDKVVQLREMCKEDINRNIDIQKHFINYGHPGFQRYENLLRSQGKIGLNQLQRDTADTEDDENNYIPGQHYQFDDEDTNQTMKWIKERANAFTHFQKDTPDISKLGKENTNHSSCLPDLFHFLKEKRIKERTNAFTQFQRDIPDRSKLGVPFETKSRREFFLEIVLAYMLILETILYDTGVKLIMYHLVHNVITFHEGADMYVELVENTSEKIDSLLEIDECKREKLESLLEQRESCIEVLLVLRESN